MKPLTLLFSLLFSIFFEHPLYAQNPCEQTEFSKKYSSGENNYINKVITTSDAGIVMAGRIKESSNQDALIIKVDSKGVIEWSKTVGTSAADQFQNVIQTSDGGYIAIGQSQTTPSHSALVCKFSSVGNVEWSKSYPTFSYNISHTSEIVELSSGGYALTTIYHPVVASSIVMRISNTGSLIWGKSYTTAFSLTSVSNSIIQQNDSLVVTGFCETGGGPLDQWRYIMKVDVNNGNVFWAKRWNTGGGDLFKSMMNKGNIFATNHNSNFTGRLSLINNSGDITSTVNLLPSAFNNNTQIENFIVSSDTGLVLPKISADGNQLAFIKFKNTNITDSKVGMEPTKPLFKTPVHTVGLFNTNLQANPSSN